jgi:Ca2+-binding EF-hand superfamily protein
MIDSVSSFSGFSPMSAMRGQLGNPFQKMDSNGDGAVDQSELGAIADKIKEKTGHSVDTDRIMTRLDSDGDGQITQTELEENRPEGPPPAMIGMMRNMMGGGLMGMQGDNTQSFLDILNESEDENASSIKDSLDTNGDGVVDNNEAQAGMQMKIQQYQNQMSGLLSGASATTTGYNLFA